MRIRHLRSYKVKSRDSKLVNLLTVLIFCVAIIAAPLSDGHSVGKASKDFYEGLRSAVRHGPRLPERSAHWLSGWDAGCSVRGICL